MPGLTQYGTERQYFATDRLGSTRQLVDPVGEVLRSQTFDPFGNVLEQGGAGQSIFGYTGEQTDPSELVFLRARYYDPRVGRFLSADSVVPDPMRSVGWNRYAYVDNNPINYIDPSGHSFRPVCFFGIDPNTGQCITLLPPAFGSTFSTPATNPVQPAIEMVIIAAYLTYRAATLDSSASFSLPDFGWSSNGGLDFPTNIPDEFQQTTTPPTGSCSIDTGYHPGPNITPKPYDFPPFDLPQPPSIDDLILADPIGPGIELTNILTIEKLKTYYGEVIEVKKLSKLEVKLLGFEEFKQQMKGSKATDDIYFEPKTGEFWIRRGSGPLIEFEYE